MDEEEIAALKTMTANAATILWWRDNGLWREVVAIGPNADEELEVGYLAGGKGEYVALSACDPREFMLTSKNLLAGKPWTG